MDQKCLVLGKGATGKEVVARLRGGNDQQWRGGGSKEKSIVAMGGDEMSMTVADEGNGRGGRRWAQDRERQ